jgi:hypothetical protein
MKADLTSQIHELMEHGVRPVSVADIESRVPVRMSARQRAVAGSRHAGRRFLADLGAPPAPRPGRGTGLDRRPHRPHRAVAAAVAAATGLAVVATVVSVTSAGGPTRQPVDSGAVQLLAKAAAAAARQPAVSVRDSQYMYVETTTAAPASPMLWTAKGQRFPRHLHLRITTSQVWVPVADVCRTGLERDITARGRPSGAPFSSQVPGMKCPNTGSLNDPTYRLLQTLPTSPHALLALIYRTEREHGPGPAQEAFVTIGDLLRNTIAPPKVTAALYRAAALIPGVTLVPHATDAIGRPGVAVGRIGPGVDGGVREELIFSKTTLRLIGERTVIARTGTTTTATAIIARAFVDHRGQVPASATAKSSAKRLRARGWPMMKPCSVRSATLAGVPIRRCRKRSCRPVTPSAGRQKAGE